MLPRGKEAGYDDGDEEDRKDHLCGSVDCGLPCEKANGLHYERDDTQAPAGGRQGE
jgi:hypothetical protein